mmetsp:Transcript_7426/g.16214  ORF Transcript_7426/g.16214 Transcript_7426/m.16214 type:complete len:330 (-) Transcript_7426:27-1016(-)
MCLYYKQMEQNLDHSDFSSANYPNKFRSCRTPSPFAAGGPSPHLILVTKTSNSSVASVLNSLSYTLFPSLLFSPGTGNCWLFLALNTAVLGSSILLTAPLRIPAIPSSNSGGNSPLPTVHATSLNSVSFFVSKYLTPPGSLAVAKDLARIVISAATLDPFPTAASPLPSRYSRYEAPEGRTSKAMSLESSGRGPLMDSICRMREATPVVSPSTGSAFSARGSMPALAGPDSAVAANRKDDAVEAVRRRAARRSETTSSFLFASPSSSVVSRMQVEAPSADAAARGADGRAEKAAASAHVPIPTRRARSRRCAVMVVFPSPVGCEAVRVR